MVKIPQIQLFGIMRHVNGIHILLNIQINNGSMSQMSTEWNIYPSNFFSVGQTVVVAHTGVLARKIAAWNVQFVLTTRAPQKVRQVLHSAHRTHFNTPNNLTVDTRKTS